MSTRTRLPGAMIRRVAALVVLGLAFVTTPLTIANAQDPAAVRAAKEIQAARDRADAAAQAMFDAESRLDTLEVEIDAAEADLAAVEAQAASMRSSLQQDAQRSFVNSGTSLPLLIDLDQANAGITADRQASVARGAASVELDDFDAVMKEVSAKRADLERQQQETEQARQQFESLKAAAEAEVVKLAEIEQQRLADVAVQQELERQRQAKLAQEAAAARQAQASNRTNVAAVAAAPAPSRGSSSASSSSGAAPAPAPAPVPASPPPSSGAFWLPTSSKPASASRWSSMLSSGLRLKMIPITS